MNNMNMRRGNNCGDNMRNDCNNRCNDRTPCDADSSQYNDPLCGMPVGIGYVPWQRWGKVYDLNEGLMYGTIFPPLNLQFYGCVPRNCRKCQGGAR